MAGPFNLKNVRMEFYFRNEDEVDEAEILVKVSKATASAFNFKVCIVFLKMELS